MNPSEPGSLRSHWTSRPASYLKFRGWLDGVLFDLGLYRGPSPTPHAIKRRIVRKYAREHGVQCFIETGTYRGDMVAAMLPHFQEVHSVELGELLYRAACERFQDVENVRLYQGDSSVVLGRILAGCRQRAVLWLDAHYSEGVTARGDEDSPIWKELNHVIDYLDRGHVVLIDDARCFVGRDGYPTLERLREYVVENMPSYRLTVADDIIRILPSAS